MRLKRTLCTFISTLVLSVVLVSMLCFCVHAGTVSGSVNMQGLGIADTGLTISYRAYNWRNDPIYNVEPKSSGSSNSLTLSVTGVSGWADNYASTLTVTLTNGSEKDKVLSFSYTKGNTNSLKIAEETVSADGSYSSTLSAKSSISIVIETAKNTTANSCVLSNIQLVSNDTVSITFENALDGKGSITFAANESNKIEYSDSLDVSSRLKPNTDYEFICWTDSSGTPLGYDPAKPNKPDEDITVYPFFAPIDSAVFDVQGKQYWYWEDAFDAAVAAGGTTVVLKESGKLYDAANLVKVGDHVKLENGKYVYTIDSRCRFLIPFSLSDTGTFASGEDFKNDSTAGNSTYCTLTVSENAMIVANGDMNVNGQRRESNNQPLVGEAKGSHGMLKLEGKGTQLQINSGKTLYCYGFISGTGTVEILSGGTLHEMLQIADWPGGTNTSNWQSAAGASNLFVLTQFYVQNIEAPLKINAGATEKVELTATVARVITVRQATDYVGSNSGLFQLAGDSYLIRTYDSSTEQMTYTFDSETTGSLNLGSVSISVSALGQGLSVTSSNYVLPVTSSMNVIVASGITATIPNSIAILPGGSIAVEKDATVNLTKNLYIIDKADWTSSMFYGSGGKNVHPLPYTPSRTGTSPLYNLVTNNSGKLVVNGTLNVSGEGGLYATNGIGANSSSADVGKIITGKGTIDHTGTQGATSLITGFYDDDNGKISYTVNTTAAVGILAGHENTSYTQFSTGTYYGHKDNFWYQYTVSVQGGSYGVLVDGDSYVGENSEYICGSPIVGYICSNGTMPFDLPNGYDVALKDTSAATLSGTTLSNPTDDVVLVLSAPFKVQMVLGSSLDMRIAFPVTFFADGSKTAILNGETVAWTATKIGDVDYFYFTVEGISAKEMADNVFFTVNGVEYGESVRSYVMRILDSDTYSADNTTVRDAARKMLVDMLNYGAAAQKLFEYNTGNLANSGLTEAQTAWGTQTNPTVENKSEGGGIGALKLDNNLLFCISGEGFTADTEVYVEYENHWGYKLHGYVKVSSIGSGDNGKLAIVINTMLISDARQEITVTYTNANGEKIVLKDSVESYIARMVSDNANQDFYNVYYAIMKFSDSAKEYLHTKYSTQTSEWVGA